MQFSLQDTGVRSHRQLIATILLTMAIGWTLVVISSPLELRGLPTPRELFFGNLLWAAAVLGITASAAMFGLHRTASTSRSIQLAAYGLAAVAVVSCLSLLSMSLRRWRVFPDSDLVLLVGLLSVSALGTFFASSGLLAAAHGRRWAAMGGYLLLEAVAVSCTIVLTWAILFLE